MRFVHVRSGVSGTAIKQANPELFLRAKMRKSSCALVDPIFNGASTACTRSLKGPQPGVAVGF